MLMFFTSVGLSADFTKLKEGGKSLLIFLVCVILFVVVQNAVGMSLATALGLDPLIGLIVGSVTLTGVMVLPVLGVKCLKLNMEYRGNCPRNGKRYFWFDYWWTCGRSGCQILD